MIKVIKSIIFLILFSLNVYAVDITKVFFSIGQKYYTTIDIEERQNYLNLFEDYKQYELENNDFYYKDLISVLLFDIVFNNNNNNNNNKLQNLVSDQYNNFFANQEINNISSEKIKKHIKYDFQRKIILETLLEENKKEIFDNNKDLNFNIYKIDLEYYSFNSKNLNILKDKIDIINFTEIEKNIDKHKDIKYLFVKKDLKLIDSLNEQIKKEVQKGSKYFSLKLNNDNFLYGKINKKIRINEDLKFSLIQITKKDDGIKNTFKCNKIKDYKKDKNLNVKISENIEYNKLNKKIRKNLSALNDNIIIKNNNKLTYIVLCDILFDKDKVKDLNIRIKINEIVDKIEKKFISINKKKYQLIKYE